jgi:very-short-patch-repair endonuclease
MRGPLRFKTARARALRRNSTDAEGKLWHHLRSRGVNGCKFVRQEPIGPFIADFVCREHRLVIEVDGGQHATDPRDAWRDRWLSEHGYRVLRFWNNDVLSNIESVLEVIGSALPPEEPLTRIADAIRPLPASGER